MKNIGKRKITIGTLIFIIAICGICLELVLIFHKDIISIFNTKKYSGVIVKVNENYLTTYGENIYGRNKLVSVSFKNNKNIEFKEGQEILVYYDANNKDPLQYFYHDNIRLTKVKKIKIIKEKSNIEVPEYALRECFSTKENIVVSINDFTKTSISIMIKDTNEYPYDYSNVSYRIYKVVPNTGTGGKKTIGYSHSNFMLEDLGENTLTTIIDITTLYDKLEKNGKYELEFTIQNLGWIRINFTMDENEELVYDIPEIEYFPIGL